jgi:hypothetical protein
MNPKHTLTWFVVAVALFAFIFAWHFFQRSNTPESPNLLPGLHSGTVTSVQVIPNNAPEISVERTNGGWVLTQPVIYPAQSTAIEGLLDALQKLTTSRITPAELSENHNVNSTYGFDTPQASLVIQSGDERREILVGNKTAPNDQVFLRVVGVEGVFVAPVSWLQFIPQSANDWRDTALTENLDGCDSITLTNGANIIELHCNPTNHLWQMTRPLQARANDEYIVGALQQLQAARVSQFVTDNSNADLTAFGLQPANLDLWLQHGSNFIAAIHLGETSTNDSTQVFARREGWSTIVTTPGKPLSSWYGKYNDFRDPYLLELTAPVAEIDMSGPGTNRLALQQEGTNAWKIAGEKIPVDADNVQLLIQYFASLRVSQFVSDVATPADLSAYGLATPSHQIILRSAVDDTNAIIAQLRFGTVGETNVFVQRTGEEDFIYAVAREDFNGLPDALGWEFRNRLIWSFSESDVTNLIVRQNGKTQEMLHKGPNQWSLASGSQGIINPPAIEEIAHQLGNLAAVAWMSRGVSNPEYFGLSPNNLSITVNLKNGESHTVDFGTRRGQTALAAVTFDGERWVFVFPPAQYLYIMNYLAPSNAP